MAPAASTTSDTSSTTREPGTRTGTPPGLQRFAIVWMTGGVAAIIAGLLTTSLAADVRLWIAPSVLVAATILAALLNYLRRDGEGSSQEARALASLALIWLPFSLGAAMHCTAVAMGIYNPIAHDGFPGSMALWWMGTIPQIAIGYGMSVAFLRYRTPSEAQRVVHRWVTRSWLAQGLVCATWMIAVFHAAS